MKLSLQMFTNCTDSAPSLRTIKRTYDSFCNTFVKMEPTIWCDPNPNKEKFDRYAKNLYNYFGSIHETKSLSDGYVQAIKSSDADWIFMLEHDWVFNEEHIKHSLEEIIQVMGIFGLPHMRFNKRKNIVKQWDSSLKEISISPIQFKNEFKYCLTPCISNNPHILNRKKYLEFIDKGYINILPGSFGIEKEMSVRSELKGAIYGGLNYPACITHLDGRGK